MTINAWVDPVVGSGRDSSRAAWNNNIENVLTLHAAAADPPNMRECMLQVRTDTDALLGRNKTNLAWLTLGKWEANLGMVRIDGSNAMTADLDYNGQRPLDIKNAGAAGLPVGNPDHRFAVMIGAVEVWIPGWLAAF